MISDSERREVARRLREIRPCKSGHIKWWEIARALGLKQPAGWFGWEKFEPDSVNRLADLIEPTCDPTGRGIDSIYDWCRERLEGADVAEDELYCSIMRAIEDYRHPERATAHTVRTVDRDALLELADEMDTHCLGHEGMEDSPVARWARELREALGGDGRDPSADVSMSAYDLLPQEERDAIAWVREHGGLERVKAQRRESMPRAAYERKKAGFLDHIAECERALGRKREIISELNHRASDLTRENAELRKRAMPEGCEWPRYESGEPAGFGDEVSGLGEVFSISLYCDGSFALNFRAYSKGESVKRPAPAVTAGDGEPLEVGQTVWEVDGTGHAFEVVGIRPDTGRAMEPTVVTCDVGVECIECGAGFACVYKDRDEAAEEWNRRVSRTCRMDYAGEVPPQIQYSCYFCSECGSPIYNDMEPSYCLYCGAKVVP